MKHIFRCRKCGRVQAAELGPAEEDPKVCPACGGELAGVEDLPAEAPVEKQKAPKTKEA